MPADQGRKPSTRSGSSTNEVMADKCMCSQDIREIKKYLENINKKLELLAELKHTVEGLEKTVSFISTQYDEIIAKNENNNKEMQKLKTQIITLDSINTNNEKQIKLLNEKLSNAEQYSRSSNVEIHGINEKPNENCKDLVVKLAQKLNLPIENCDVDVAHRITSSQKNHPKPIIAQFLSRTKRDLLLQKKKLCVTDMSLPVSSVGSTVYINENISPYFKNLYRLAKTASNNSTRKFQYIWFKNSKLFIRKNPGSPIHRILCEDDINRYITRDHDNSSVN